jgi:hypothetical protein
VRHDGCLLVLGTAANVHWQGRRPGTGRLCKNLHDCSPLDHKLNVRWVPRFAVGLERHIVAQKVPALHALAPPQSELPFLITQVVALVIFLVVGVSSLIRFRPESTPDREKLLEVST